MARKILDGINHGQSGYRRGCGCAVCREAHTAANRRWREKKRAVAAAEKSAVDAVSQQLTDLERPMDDSQAPMVIDTRAEAGPIETAFATEFESLVGSPPWKNTLGALAKADARIVDQMHLHGRLDVLSGVQLRLLDILDRMRRTPSSASVEGGVPADWSGILGTDD